MDSPISEDSEQKVLSQYLDTVALPVELEVNIQIIRSGAWSVYKYKPVALNTWPAVVQELPADFSIKMEITGDSLAEMPKLSPNPPDYVPTGRYTQ